MSELICPDDQTYEDRAVALAMDAESLEALRRRLAGARATAPLYDLAGFARQLEAAYRAMWQHHREGSTERRLRIADGVPG